MVQDVKVFTGTAWESIKGPKGDDGVPGPTEVSADAGNTSTLGSDNKIFTPPETMATVGYECAGGEKRTLADLLDVVRTFAGCSPAQPVGTDGKALVGWAALAAKAAQHLRVLPDGTAVAFDPAALALYFNTRTGVDPNSRAVQVPLAQAGGVCNVTVDWGDGTAIETVTASGIKAHTYAQHGSYLVQIRGQMEGFGVPVGTLTLAGYDKLQACVSFGTLGITQMTGLFAGCRSLVVVPPTLPPGVTSLREAFYGCVSFNQPIANWDVSKVADFNFMFYNCALFNQPLNAWDTASATSMNGVFDGCTLFNQPLSNWKMGSVVTCTYIFNRCPAFNQPLAAWDMSQARLIRGMFANCTAFNQPLNAWNTVNATDTNQMFTNCVAFNQSLSNWKMGLVSNVYRMFIGCTNFNQSLASWDMASVSNAGEMLRDCTNFSTANYDATLVAWAGRHLGPPAWKTPLSIQFTPAKSSTAGGGAAAKATLNSYGWTILDGGNV